jgi:hypothetical protein
VNNRPAVQKYSPCASNHRIWPPFHKNAENSLKTGKKRAETAQNDQFYLGSVASRQRRFDEFRVENPL